MADITFNRPKYTGDGTKTLQLIVANNVVGQGVLNEHFLPLGSVVMMYFDSMEEAEKFCDEFIESECLDLEIERH